MAARAKLIAELSSNFGGDVLLAAEMIRAAAASGADYAKVQIYNAALLRDDDPQKSWLTQAQVTRPMLDELLRVASENKIELTASVFGIPEAQMAQAAGLHTIKIGSGDSGRSDLLAACLAWFPLVWISQGINPTWVPRIDPSAPMVVVRFHGLSQYPAPPARNLARLLQCDKTGTWGWSDHGVDLAIAHQALTYGCTYLERHFCLPHAGRRQDWDTTPAQFLTLRKYAEAVAWENTSEHAEAQAKFLGRWGGSTITQPE